MIICAAYGSQRHLGVYKELGLQPDQIFIHGKKLKKPLQDCQVGRKCKYAHTSHVGCHHDLGVYYLISKVILKYGFGMSALIKILLLFLELNYNNNSF